MTSALDQSPFLRACRREPVASPPIWLMRQAGRYLKEYREIRERVPFLEMCKDPDLVTEVTEYAARRLGVDAAIIFSDLLLPVESFGLRLTYEAGDGPAVSPPIRGAADIDRLREPDLLADLGYVFEGIRRTRRALPPGMPLIGFSGAPFTLASYMIEGGGSASYRHTKALMFGDLGAWNALMGKTVRLLGAYLNAQVAAGAQAVQIFDSWVGCLAPDDFRDFALPHVRALVAAVQPGVPVIYFGTQTGALLKQIRSTGAGVIGVDWRVDLLEAWETLGEVAIMGNLDPVALFAPRDEVVRRARALLDRAGAHPGWIFNLGHGILPHTPVDNVLALVETVHAWQSAPMTRAFDSVLLLAFGGPSRPEEIRPFLDNVLRGRPVPAERYEEVVQHYIEVGGSSPLARLTDSQAEGLRTRLAGGGPDLPVFVGMRHWHPYVRETLQTMTAAGLRRAVGIVLAAHPSPATREAYHQAVSEARRHVGADALVVEFVGAWHEHPLFIEALADRLRDARAEVPPARRDAAALVFTAHSLPVAMSETSGYEASLRRTAELVARAAGVTDWRLAWQSRSGGPHEPWLEPDVRDVVAEVARQGSGDVVLAPIGFVSDHVEVLYDLDIQARAAADAAGIGFHRAGTAGSHPAFLDLLAELVRGRVGQAEA